MNENVDMTAAADDADLAALLRKVGERPAPSAAAAAEVRAAVASEWRAAVAARQRPARNTPRVWLAMAASVAAVAVAVGIALPRWNAAGDPVATVARLAGPAEVRHVSDGVWEPLAAGATLRADDEIRTPAASRVALSRPDGVEVRLDGETQLAFVSGDRARLDGGSVYVDAGSARRGNAALVVTTPLGDVRHLGTQYVVTLRSGALQVAVREGSVAVDRGHAPVVARAGEKLAVAADGSVTRSRQAAYGEAWQWAEAMAPGFAIEGRTLDEFLAWAGRETGRTVVYTSAAAAREAEQVRLKGSVEGLAPVAAVDAVFASAPSLQHEVAGGQIRVELASH